MGDRRHAALSLGLVLLMSCSHGNNGNSPATTEPSLRGGVVTLRPRGRLVRVEVEVADTDTTRARGLMFRKELKPLHGMYFIFERQETLSFYMKNTYIPLDMIFINRDHKVAGVVHSAEPLTLTSRQVDAPSIYVLEVRGGFAKDHGIVAGTPVSFAPRR